MMDSLEIYVSPVPSYSSLQEFTLAVDIKNRSQSDFIIGQLSFISSSWNCQIIDDM